MSNVVSFLTWGTLVFFRDSAHQALWLCRSQLLHSELSVEVSSPWDGTLGRVFTM